MSARSLADGILERMSDNGLEFVRPAGLFILASLHEYDDGMSVTALAKKCGVSKQAISQILEGLERSSLVMRKNDPADGRVKVVLLSKKGAAIWEGALRSGDETEAEVADLVGKSAVEELRKTLTRYLEARGAWHPGEPPDLRQVW